MLRAALATAVIALLAARGAADGDSQQSLGDGYTLLVDRTGLQIVKGKQRAHLAEAQSILSATVDKKAKKVDVTVGDFTCAGEHKFTWTFGHFDARLENTAAFQLHKKKDWKGAAAGFARAVAADPSWTIPAYNLASADQLAGDKDAAVKALAPWLASAAVATYVQVTGDPELSPLLDRPEVKAVRSATPGNASITALADIDGGVAYSKDKGLIAVARTEASWGACVYQTDLELRDAKSGALVAHTPIVAWNETSDCMEVPAVGVSRRARAAIAKRIKALTAMLRELGFSKVKTEKATTDRSSDGDKYTARFKKAKLGVVAAGGTARALLKDTELGTASILEHLKDVVYVEDPRMVVVWSLRPGAEGCEGTDPTDVAVIALPAP